MWLRNRKAFLKGTPNELELGCKSITYFAHFHSELPGVTKKINHTVAALRKQGWEASSEIVRGRGLGAHLFAFRKLASNKSSVVVVRNTLYSMPLLAFAIIYLRLLGKKVTVDVPTPVANVVWETLSRRDIGKAKKIMRVTLLFLIFPWSLWAANMVVQYSIEGKYFLIGLQKKTKLVSNGILVEKVPVRRKFPAWPNSKFHLIAVASVSPWHGLDRVIFGIRSFLDRYQDLDFEPHLTIVGEGHHSEYLHDLVEELKLQNNVAFVGFCYGSELNELFDQSHVAVSSLGLFRINLNLASVLKSREYTARGIPFVFSGKDMDFDRGVNFVLEEINSHSILDINAIADWYGSLEMSENVIGEIRRYAEDHLDYESKIGSLIP